MGRPRGPGKTRLPQGLYERNGYWSWLDRRSGKEWGIGRVPRSEAIQLVLEVQEHPEVAAERFGRRSETVRLLATLSAEEIIAAAVPHRHQCGVYFLVKDSRVMYVGQSTHAGRRVPEHLSTGKPFDAYHFVPVPEPLLDDTEAAYILALNPPWNLALPARGR